MTRASAEDTPVEGYASLWWTRDLADDVVAAGAFDALAELPPGRVKMLHGHDDAAPVGVWDQLTPDARGLFVRGRILPATPAGRACAALVRAGALDGLSIGFRTLKARSDPARRLRVLTAIDLQEVSLVTFPMLREARLFLSPERTHP